MKYNDGILQTLSDSFQNAEKRHGTIHWQSVEVRKDDNNILYFLSFSFLFLSLFSSFLDLPFLSLCRRDRKGKERELGERKERKKERKGKEREFIAVIFPCSPFFTFYFPFSPFFFPLFALFSLADATSMMSYVAFQT